MVASPTVTTDPRGETRKERAPGKTTGMGIRKAGNAMSGWGLSERRAAGQDCGGGHRQVGQATASSVQRGHAAGAELRGREVPHNARVPRPMGPLHPGANNAT